MPTPRPIDPYRPPEKREKPAEPLASAKKFSGGQLVLIFFAPLIFFALCLGTALMSKGDLFIVLGFWGTLIGMLVVSIVIASHFAGDGEGRGGRLIGFFLLTAVAEIFVSAVACFGGCIFLFNAFG